MLADLTATYPLSGHPRGICDTLYYRIPQTQTRTRNLTSSCAAALPCTIGSQRTEDTKENGLEKAGRYDWGEVSLRLTDFRADIESPRTRRTC